MIPAKASCPGKVDFAQRAPVFLNIGPIRRMASSRCKWRLKTWQGLMRIVLLPSLVSGVLAACQAPDTVSTPTAPPASPVGVSLTLPAAASATPEAQHPEATDLATVTAETPTGLAEEVTPAPASPTQPTPSPPATRRPAAAATCPPADGPPPPLDYADPSQSVGEAFTPQLLDYLNTVGSPTGLQEALGDLTITIDGALWRKAQAQVLTADVTGDTAPEVVVDLLFYEPGQYAEGAVFVFSCRDRQYQGGPVLGLAGQVLTAGPDPSVVAIADMNGDGVPELVLATIEIIGTHANFTRAVWILTWDGDRFASLLPEDPHFSTPARVNNGDGVLQDSDGDGRLELLLRHGVGRGPDVTYLERAYTEVWAWDGEVFSPVCTRAASPPLYRIQAIVDGDDATRCRDYEAALAFYQQAIFDEQLFGWNQGHPAFVSAGGATPAPDPDERSRLSAYGRYRILLLHSVRGYRPAAQIVYDTLQQKFPGGAVGHAYAELAASFWEPFTAGKDPAAACDRAIDYAAAHPEETLTRLGSSFYGFGQRDYAPEDICPFG